MAATKENMTLRMEPELKAQAAALFKSLGMDLSTATGIFYRQAPVSYTHLDVYKRQGRRLGITVCLLK